MGLLGAAAFGEETLGLEASARGQVAWVGGEQGEIVAGVKVGWILLSGCAVGVDGVGEAMGLLGAAAFGEETLGLKAIGGGRAGGVSGVVANRRGLSRWNG